MLIKKGQKVKFVGSSAEQVNWGSNDDPIKYLKIGNIYTIDHIEIHKWYTKFYLKEVPSKKFNGVSFKIVMKKRIK